MGNSGYNLSDPVVGVHRAVSSYAIEKGRVFSNGSGWSDPRVDELFAKATVEPDPKKRGVYYAEALEIVAENVPIIWTHEMNFPTVINNKFKDVIVSPLGVYSTRPASGQRNCERITMAASATNRSTLLDNSRSMAVS